MIISSKVRLARTAGVLYLLVAILGGFAEVVRDNVYAPGDAAATTANVAGNAGLVRLGFVADLVQATLMLFVVLVLYRLLHHVNEFAARSMVTFVIVSVAITCLNMVHQFGALLVATDPAYAQAPNLLILLLLDLQHHGYLISQIFFGLWLFPLGMLVYRSTMFPRPLGVLLMLGTVAYLTDAMLWFLAPNMADVVSAPVLIPVVIVAEVSMVAYLLIKGVKASAVTGSPPAADRTFV